ncbi:hypothetical protein SCP_1301800 [Sparassis crispa]|uniref:Uncharacterized protein n=1 Tax=Sparassis crispa TaxID=139825 RepID=A0A401H1Q5_9APHY|nr:hypothetical protein SCP_1301800 [Sparassis crispa]GBE88365.1 hypothetical protein SCP_1301800 [Sparassis crispa]
MMKTGTAVFNSSATNESYSKVSGDFNPIHVNPYFADLAALPATITHGMWSSAATRRYVETVIAQGRPERVVAYDVAFVEIVIPGDELQARSVWDAADAHLTAVYGFSIVQIIKDNPKEKTIHFGQTIRQRYMDMTYDTMDKDGNVKTLPLFGDINVRTQCYTFSHPSGLLFATQFAQIALVVTERAAFEDMLSSLVDVVFYRGITIQRAVERDAHNRSNYAVNPSRISKTFTDAALREVIDDIAHRTQCLHEIVNYNVEGQQYVCAGELVALQTMTNVLNYLKIEKVDIAKLTVKFTVGEIINSCFTRAKDQQKAEGYIKLERGFATIPLPGIDVPFHSRYLWAGVMPFRAYLSKKVNAAHLNPDTLIGKYVPNLIAKPFQVTKD